MRPLDGYPTSIGSSVLSIRGVAGPSSYTQLSLDSPPNPNPTWGQQIQAVQFGMKFFDYVQGSLSDSGVYFVRCIPDAPSGNPSAPATQIPLGAQKTTYTVVWYFEASGAEVAAGTN